MAAAFDKGMKLPIRKLFSICLSQWSDTQISEERRCLLFLFIWQHTAKLAEVSVQSKRSQLHRAVSLLSLPFVEQVTSGLPFPATSCHYILIVSGTVDQNKLLILYVAFGHAILSGQQKAN